MSTHARDIRYQKSCGQTNRQVCQLFRLAYIPTCQSPSQQIVYNTGRHRASGGLFLTRSAMVGQVCHTGLMTVERVIDFFIFDLGGLPLGQRSPKWEMTYYPPRSTVLQNFSTIAQTVCGGQSSPKGEMTWRTARSTILQNSIAVHQPMPEISITTLRKSNGQKNKQTVTDISPACLSACGDNRMRWF